MLTSSGPPQSVNKENEYGGNYVFLSNSGIGILCKSRSCTVYVKVVSFGFCDRQNQNFKKYSFT